MITRKLTRERERERELQDTMIWYPVQYLMGEKSIGGFSSVASLKQAVAEWMGIDMDDVPFSNEIGVPLTFLSKYCPTQFEIVGSSLMLAKPISDFINVNDTYQKGGPSFYIDEGNGHHKRLYNRIVLKPSSTYLENLI